MIGSLGTFLRILRIQHHHLLKDMADILGVSAAFLSAVENGKRNMPSTWVEKIGNAYDLTPEKCEELRLAAMDSRKSLTLNLESADKMKRKLAVSFARCFENIDQDTTEQIMKILNEHKQGDMNA